ncbi:MAG: aldose epimerase family protein [Vicinamibacterales bacterium]
MVRRWDAPFGRLPDGRRVAAFSLVNAAGVHVTVVEWGATVVRWLVPGATDREAPVNVVLGFDALAPYLARPPYFGCTIGRYANRIAHGRFVLDGSRVELAGNDGPHHLHGGTRGFDQRVWQACETPGGVEFHLHSPAGDEGYPGALDAHATFTLDDDGTLRIDYRATTSAPTVVNLTHHSYFNLAGHGDVLDHELHLRASRYTPVDAAQIPIGTIAPVAGTPLDFTRRRRIGERIAALAALPGGGYDHNFVLDRAPGSSTLVVAAEAIDPASGRTLRCRTTEPGLQFYTGNFLVEGLPVTPPLTTGKHAGFSLEPQHYPDSPNQPTFPSTVLRPDEEYRSTTEYRIA